MSIKKTVVPGKVCIERDEDRVQLIAVPDLILVDPSKTRVMEEFTWDELQTLIGKYYTLVPVEKPKRWVVEIEDCLRPWEKIEPLGPFDTKQAAISNAWAWAYRKESATAYFLRPAYAWAEGAQPSGVDLYGGASDTAHYRIAWREGEVSE